MSECRVEVEDEGTDYYTIQQNNPYLLHRSIGIRVK